ncbi:MAG: cation-translocating P-type ATPase [Undibacterium sp.]|nr:cation-translocating P-type ATPase [Undibacterium sp.]
MNQINSDVANEYGSLSASRLQTEPAQREKLSLSGMHCAACVQLIEFRVRQLPGVLSFNINVASHRADLLWEPSQLSLRKIIAAIVDLGYAAFPANQSPDEHERQESKMELWRLFIAGFAMMQIMMYAFPAYLVPVPQVDGDLTPDLDRLLKLASLLITIPVICFSSLPFFRGAIRDIRNRYVGMDVPVSLGILLTFFASIWATFKGGAVYYDSAIMFVFLLLGARYIEARVQRKTTAALRVLTQLTPVMAQRMLAFPSSRQTELVETQALQSGDYLLVAAGEQIPADGIVIEGYSECDESLMTGESRAVVKDKNAKLIAGSINLNGVLVMRAAAVGNATQLSALVAMMERAATEKPPLVQLADKHASRFLLVILCIALLTAVVWWQIDSSRAIWIAISVIVVTCPCALSLATPGVMSAAIGQLAKQGILVARGRAIESLARATHFVFDKTGTLTYGKLKLLDSILLATDDTDHAMLDAEADAISLSLSLNSQHPVSKAIADALSAKPRQEVFSQKVLEWIDLHEIPGAGIEAKMNGKIYRLGRLDFVQGLHGVPYQVPEQFSGKTLSALGNEQGWIAVYALADCLREDAAEAIKTLQERGLKTLLLSGDRIDVVQKIAVDCGLENARGELSPGDKYDIIKRMQADGAVVVMVGDGMNDGPALSLADVSIVMGQGAPISQSRSDLLLMSNRLTDLAYGVKLSSFALKLIRQNLTWAIAYNLVAIPAAVTGLLEPWHAALGMSLSSLMVVFNALRLLAVNQEIRSIYVTEMQSKR